MLTTFQLVNNNEIISPVLTTIREYGNWFEDTFDKYTAQLELYMKSKKKNGESVLEWHPGTKIGAWFDSNKINSDKYLCWFIPQDSSIMDKLVKINMAEYKDAIPVKSRKALRVYTVDQIELYVKSTTDKNFKISEYLGTPKQIKVKDSELGMLQIPKLDTSKKRLF